MDCGFTLSAIDVHYSHAASVFKEVSRLLRRQLTKSGRIFPERGWLNLLQVNQLMLELLVGLPARLVFHLIGFTDHLFNCVRQDIICNQTDAE